MAPSILLLVFIVFSIFLFLYFIPLGLWFQSGVSIGFGKVGMLKLIVMRFRKISPRLIVDGIINLHRAGLDFVLSEDLESHFLAGGDVIRVVDALIAADKANIELSFQTATAIDLAGRDVKEAVQTSVYPKVIDCPKDGKVSAVAQDGIQLLAKGRVTVRTNIEQLVGGATDDTVIARVGEGIVSAIGSAKSYKAVLENPDEISKSVLAKGLDAGTAYSILSIDIADIDVGQNIGAQLETDQAEADKKVAQAKAESRRAMAVASEQENKAKVEEMRAKVVEAEAEIPLAMAEAFKSGKLGVMDYYNMKNIMADTSMRESIAKDTDNDDK
ncbi:MAG: flotillin-like protein FloA [Candidatus Marinimicrobia bacterium]|nr:flotillin-like protein FloA [Candidatus Neomarinimicrobiota bacterium]